MVSRIIDHFSKTQQRMRMKQIQSSIIRMTPTRFVTSSHVALLDVLFF